jgi:hypothetical protein
MLHKTPQGSLVSPYSTIIETYVALRESMHALPAVCKIHNSASRLQKNIQDTPLIVRALTTCIEHHRNSARLREASLLRNTLATGAIGCTCKAYSRTENATIILRAMIMATYSPRLPEFQYSNSSRTRQCHASQKQNMPCH